MKSVVLNFGKNLRYYLRVKDVEVELNCQDTLQKHQLISLLKLFGDVLVFDWQAQDWVKA
ncbi:hypothetical protein [Campylobacter sp. RM15925]|uniref:hypothetical protein n=1 Tax=Campylobacter sp. RM15925 TaxID=1705724 RepID=UPI001475068D|nr:hypothetical protein [Campylobacter sp. RM15925]